jgi:hypothetical protein
MLRAAKPGDAMARSNEFRISARLRAAHRRLERLLLIDSAPAALAAAAGTGRYGFENILGVGLGQKVSEGQETGEPCVSVYVMAKAAKRSVVPAALVPARVGGVATDVVAVGELVAQPYRGRYRPAPSGVSIGHVAITAGTLGALVKRGRKRFLLSNNHVLANSNDAASGDAIVQPGPYDGGKDPKDRIARLSEFVRIRFGGSAANLVDAAIAEPLPGTLVKRDNVWFGRAGTKPVAAELNLLVKKAGRTTQNTRGRVSGLNASVRVNYGAAGVALFRNQILIVSLTSQPFSQGGDSGSLIVTDAGRKPVGLLFAGSASHTIASPIGAVLAALDVKLG